jgi:hypothetical protein
MKAKNKPAPDKVQIAMYVLPEVRERLRDAARREARTVASWLHFHVLRKLDPEFTANID